MFAFYLLSSCIITACNTQDNNNLIIYKDMNAGIEKSCEIIKKQSLESYHSLDTKLTDPIVTERITVWYLKAIRFKHYSDSLCDFIDNLKGILYKTDDYLQKTKREVVNNLLVSGEAGKKLYAQLKDYKDSVLIFDTRIKTELKEGLLLNLKFTQDRDVQEFQRSYFLNRSVAETILILSQLENNIRIVENEAVHFCDIMTNPGCILTYERNSALISQSSTIVKPGEEIRITGGVGSFSIESKPSITIAGILVPVNTAGTAIYSLKAATKPGKYIIPVEVQYWKPDGTKNTERLSLSYEVREK